MTLESVMNGIEAATQSITQFTALIASVTVLVTTVGAFITPIREWFIRKIKDKFTEKNKIDLILSDVKKLNDGLEHVNVKMVDRDAEMVAMKAAIVASLRNDITTGYYRALDEGGVTDKGRENLIGLCDVYFKLGGNCFVHDIYKDVMHMPRITESPKRKGSKPYRRPIPYINRS